MEILKESFEESLPMLQKAIAECDFVAMDTEMTGLAMPQNIPRDQDSLVTRYTKVSKSASNFLVIQLGICTFTWNDSKAGYEARPFNFPCFPSSADEAKAGERFFQCQSTSLEFLINNGFDFNKWIRHGIPYLTRPEEDAYLIRKTEKEALRATSNEASRDIPIDDRNRAFMTSTTEQIKEWLQNSTEPTLTIQANNSFFRRLVHQLIRNEFNDNLNVTSQSQQRTMTISKMTDEIRAAKELAKMAQPPKLNLRRVLDMISESKKPLIGHNCFLDLMQISSQFMWDLPFELEDWKKALLGEWKTIIDTKYLATHPLISPHLVTSGLENVSQCVQQTPFSTVGPKIYMAEGFDRYPANAAADAAEAAKAVAAAKAAADTAAIAGIAPAPAKENGNQEEVKEANYHEAGYDAYITGQAFLRFAGFILKERERQSTIDNGDEVDADESGDVGSPSRKKRKIEVEGIEESTAQVAKATEDTVSEDGEVVETELEKEETLRKRQQMILDNPTQQYLENAELKDCYNLLHMMRSDIEVMNLAGPEEEPQDRPFNFLLRNLPSNYTNSTLFHLFRPLNAYRFNRVDSTSAWLLISRFPAPPPVEAGAEPVETLRSSVMLDEPEVTVPLGPLGEEYVTPLMVGDSELANKGRSLGMKSVEEAAAIEIVGWKSWYLEREASERQVREAQKALILEQDQLRQRQAEEQQRHLAQQREQREQQRQQSSKPVEGKPKAPLKRKQDDAELDSREETESETSTPTSAPATARVMTTEEAVAALEAALDAE
ncbi:poly(A)-specific ribonuclease [Entomortierella parvispora]|uniref:Poly(A)-specific ribonuclease n=1 Tax=Entomortierella parvispora TaxID=205924 RepID=A0A9P3HKI9_9FUNG|nr:poly(A)-specific ribonuclease [Entomortierella parvispora]